MAAGGGGRWASWWGRDWRQTRPHNCVQTVLAFGLDVEVGDIERLAGTTAHMTLADVQAVLARLGLWVPIQSAGLVAAWWPEVRRRYGGGRLRGWGFRLPRQPGEDGHAYLLAGRRMLDPRTGEWRAITAAAIREAFDRVALVPPQVLEESERLAALRTRRRRRRRARARDAAERREGRSGGWSAARGAGGGRGGTAGWAGRCLAGGIGAGARAACTAWWQRWSGCWEPGGAGGWAGARAEG